MIMAGLIKKVNRRRWIKGCLSLACGLLLLIIPSSVEAAASGAAPVGIHIKFDSAESPADVSNSIKIVLLLTILSLAPSAVMMMTSFMRIVIVIDILKRALGTQQAPPSSVVGALSIFLTVFIMMPIWQKINTEAVQPYMAEEIGYEEAWTNGIAPLRRFMAMQTGDKEMALFVDLSGIEPPETLDDVPTQTLIPAFMISELKTAFQMGFLIYLPFLVIDLVIASSLMSLGMMMLPPMMISLPIKILFFVLADGWTLIVRGIVSSFSL